MAEKFAALCYARHPIGKSPNAASLIGPHLKLHILKSYSDKARWFGWWLWSFKYSISFQNFVRGDSCLDAWVWFQLNILPSKSPRSNQEVLITWHLMVVYQMLFEPKSRLPMGMCCYPSGTKKFHKQTAKKELFMPD